MPFLRHARDKRGYETTFVMHAYRPGAGQAAGRTRLLYMFRSPSNRKVGRNFLEPEVMEALEHTHPDLTFDWQSMLRAPAQVISEPERERGERGDRGDRGERHERGRNRSERGERKERGERGERPERRERPDQAAHASRPEAVVAELPAAALEDESLLGKAAGAAEAARMRAAYNELVQRIARRSRTPEERDRLIERATRLNPDEWADEAAIAAGVAEFTVECEAIRQELPRRRRGRRGGRARDREPGGSAIIGHDQNELEMVGPAGADDRSLDGDVGAGDSGAADPDDAGSPAGDAVHDVD